MNEFNLKLPSIHKILCAAILSLVITPLLSLTHMALVMGSGWKFYHLILPAAIFFPCTGLLVYDYVSVPMTRKFNLNPVGGFICWLLLWTLPAMLISIYLLQLNFEMAGWAGAVFLIGWALCLPLSGNPRSKLFGILKKLSVRRAGVWVGCLFSGAVALAVAFWLTPSQFI